MKVLCGFVLCSLSIILLWGLEEAAAKPNGFGVTAPPATCRRWCLTPERQTYCCEGANEPEGPVGVKPGFCPDVRPQCPPVRFGGPEPCSNDYRCFGSDKCCYDRCLEQHVCKPLSIYG
ncbi:antileukoproteinase-like [Palaemon carinicauda]|uniref:antileukoproteinase-like n=1 Tax=Palaemon carinicauda TaxID=392227 RepID=UPI0035B5FBED